MADKKIIIDDVDVSECEFLWKEKLPQKVCNNGNLDYDCNSHQDCIFRRMTKTNNKLQIKEQECEILKEKIIKYSKINEQDTKDFAILHNSFIEIEGLVKNFCEDCSEYERCDYEKDGCYYSILPRLKDIIKKLKSKGIKNVRK